MINGKKMMICVACHGKKAKEIKFHNKNKSGSGSKQNLRFY